MKFQFVVNNLNEKKHSAVEPRKDVRVGGLRAKALFTSDKKAAVLKRQIVSESSQNMFEPPKGRDISGNAIRSGQCRQRQTKKMSYSPLQALEYLKVSNLYRSTIHMTGINPFFVIYGSPNQFLLFNAYKKHNAYTKMSCDATGELVHKLCR